MSKESGAPDTGVLSQADVPSKRLSQNTSSLPSLTFRALLPVEDTETLSSNSAVRSEQIGDKDEANLSEQHGLTEDSDSRIRTLDEQVEATQGLGRYEYMDIRRSDSEGDDRAQKRHGSLKSAKSATETEETDEIVEVLMKEPKEEEEKYHNINKQTPLQGNLSALVVPRPDVLKAGGESVEEYEEMTRLEAEPTGWEQADYQNVPVKGKAVPGETASGRCAGIGGYIKVCTGMGEPGSNTSFDNPDYWRSRLFLKPDAVRT